MATAKSAIHGRSLRALSWVELAYTGLFTAMESFVGFDYHKRAEAA
jgi:hypothetical protein